MQNQKNYKQDGPKIHATKNIFTDQIINRKYNSNLPKDISNKTKLILEYLREIWNKSIKNLTIFNLKKKSLTLKER